MDEDAIRWERVRRLTFVPFLHDGRCALVPAGGGLVLPSGAVLDGEDPLASSYVPVGDRSRHADQVLRRLGFPVDGRTERRKTRVASTSSGFR